MQVNKVIKIDLPLIAASISILPFYGYFIAYTYESGYLSEFGIPAYLVQVDISTIMLAIIYITVIGTFSTLLMAKFIPLYKKFIENLFLYPFILYCTVVGLSLITIVILSPKNLSAMPLIMLLLLPVTLFIEFVLPVFEIRTFKSYQLNLINYRKKRAQSNSSSEILTSKNQYLNLIWISLLSLFLTYIFMKIVGQANAKNNSMYYVFKKQDETYALIRNYRNEKIAIKYKDDILIPGELYLFDTSELILSKKYLELPYKQNNSLFKIGLD